MYIWTQIGNSAVTILVTLAFYGCYRLCAKAYSIYANHRRWCRTVWIAKIMTIYCGTIFAILGIAETNRLYNNCSNAIRNVSKIIYKLNNFESSISCMTQKNKTPTANNPSQNLNVMKDIMATISPVKKNKVLSESAQEPAQQPVQNLVHQPVQESAQQVNPVIDSANIKNNLNFNSKFPLDIDAIMKKKNN